MKVPTTAIFWAACAPVLTATWRKLDGCKMLFAEASFIRLFGVAAFCWKVTRQARTVSAVSMLRKK
jgi:hypothetical protein